VARQRTRVCNVSGCPVLTSGSARCDAHTKSADRARGTAAQRGYGREHQTRFREGVLARDPYCVVRGPRCTLTSTVADHWPRSRRELVDAGADPNEPTHGRGVCHTCHATETAKHQPGGWHDPLWRDRPARG
jgi:5-methylcytosine-specific restriction enzyme A